MDMLGYACLTLLNVILMSGYGTILSEYALSNRDITLITVHRHYYIKMHGTMTMLRSGCV